MYIKTAILACMFFVQIIILACNSSIEPLDKRTGVYAIYGALDMDKQTNYIRVRDLNAPFTAAATEFLDAEITLENLNNGVIANLSSERKEYDGVFLHNFLVNQEILPNSSYKLTARRSDGITVSVTTLSPTRPILDVLPVNGNCYEPITVEFSPTNGGKIVYRLGFGIGDILFKSPHILKETEETPGVINLTFTPFQELKTFRRSCYSLNDTNLYVEYAYYSEGLYPYEEVPITANPFDIFQSTQVFGAYFENAIFSFPIDTSKVCPQDCQ